MSAAKPEKPQKVESETLANHFRFLSEFPSKCYTQVLLQAFLTFEHGKKANHETSSFLGRVY